jgi:polysaccharide export outer membrane protein
MALRRYLSVFAAAVLAASGTLEAQEVGTGMDPGRIQVTRADLHTMLERLDQAASSRTYSKPVRDKASAEAAMIRERLVQGDFQVGDRIALVVEGEPTLSDTFSVLEPRVLRLPVVGDVPMTGVLRSELETHIQAYLAKFMREPVVRARSLIRLALLGEVTKPGFYVMPTDIVLSDALMLAGGPTGSAKMKKVRIERDGDAIWHDEALQQALAEGRTLDQLNLRAGDQVVMPKSTGSVLVRAAPVLLALTTTLWLIFDNDN